MLSRTPAAARLQMFPSFLKQVRYGATSLVKPRFEAWSFKITELSFSSSLWLLPVSCVRWKLRPLWATRCGSETFAHEETTGVLCSPKPGCQISYGRKAAVGASIVFVPKSTLPLIVWATPQSLWSFLKSTSHVHLGLDCITNLGHSRENIKQQRKCKFSVHLCENFVHQFSKIKALSCFATLDTFLIRLCIFNFKHFGHQIPKNSKLNKLSNRLKALRPVQQ